MNIKRRRSLLAIGAAMVAPLSHAGPLTDWPSRPVRLVVAAPPGGGTDVLARLLAERFTAIFRQPFVVENRPGANGIIASDAVARSAPDGYTLLMSYSAAMVISPAVYERAPDPVGQFEAIAQVGSVGNLLVASPSLHVRNLKDLIRYARAHPGEVSYGTWGVASAANLAMETLLSRAGLKMNHVAYKGVANVATDLLSGTVPVGWLDVSSQIQLVKAGKVVPLAVSGGARVPQLPDVPTMTEQGYPFEITTWYGLFAPARTPKAIVDRLNAEVNQLLATQDFQARLYALNLPVTPRTDAMTFRQRVSDDQAAWRKLARQIGIKPE